MRIFSPHFIIASKDSVPYLRRWFLTPWSDDKHKLKNKRLPNMYLHQILKSDDDRALHDHPWNNLSIILWGGYDEYMFARPPVNGLELPPIIKKRRRMFHIVFRKADMSHRLDLRDGKLKVMEYSKVPAGQKVDMYFYDGKTRKFMAVWRAKRPCLSIFITWRKRREWGFWCKKTGSLGRAFYPAKQAVKDDTGKIIKYQDITIALNTPGEVAHWVHQDTFQTQNGCTA